MLRIPDCVYLRELRFLNYIYLFFYAWKLRFLDYLYFFVMSAADYVSGAGGTLHALVPSWDGNPAKWRDYQQEVKLWQLSENLEVNQCLASRLVLTYGPSQGRSAQHGPRDAPPAGARAGR